MSKKNKIMYDPPFDPYILMRYEMHKRIDSLNIQLCDYEHRKDYIYWIDMSRYNNSGLCSYNSFFTLKSPTDTLKLFRFLKQNYKCFEITVYKKGTMKPIGCNDFYQSENKQ